MELPKNLLQSIRDNSLVIFAGSGLSTKFNLPSWKKLVIDIIKGTNNSHYMSFVDLIENGVMNPVQVLNFLQNEHTDIYRYIKTNFNISSGDISLHKKIIGVTDKIITTNYDNAFEKAFENSITPTVYTSDFNVSEINKTLEPYILKLHGTFSEPDKCILFESDYRTLYSTKPKSATQKLSSIFSEKTILFIGYSFNDVELNLLFKELDLVFGNNNKHFIITKEKNFSEFKFLEVIPITHYGEIENVIDQCLEIKQSTESNLLAIKNEPAGSALKNVAYLFPDPIDINLRDDFTKIESCFESLKINISIGHLNTDTLNKIEDYDLVVIVSRVYKGKLYIENANLVSDQLSPIEICENIPNDKIPIVFITDHPISVDLSYRIANISSFKPAIIKRFIYKALKCNEFEFAEAEINLNTQNAFDLNLERGSPKIHSIYENNPKNLDIDDKGLTSLIGRIEEQSTIISKILLTRKNNKFLNIKASGGIGKTTLIKKVASDLFYRGHFKDGVTFKSCESAKSFSDFQEILISGFRLTNIINFKEYLVENYSTQKKDILIILDNFETVINNAKGEISEVIDLLKFTCDYGTIVLTSRERINLAGDFEDVFSLTTLTTDDAYALFIKYYGPINESEIQLLRSEILEETLNNNPLAIKLITKSRVKEQSIQQLRDELRIHFFESMNEDYAIVYKDAADLNIERNKSIFHSINYSYTTLNTREKLAFQILSLFPDGISLSNFRKCFEKSISANKITDKELRILRDKSLVEESHGVLQLQPMIRRFADHQFSLEPQEVKNKYLIDAYIFNCFILDIISLIHKKRSHSEALKSYQSFKNNLIKVLNYITDLEIKPKSNIPEKKYLLNYIYDIDDYIVSEKQVEEFQISVSKLLPYFSDLPNAELLIKVLQQRALYYHEEFNQSYKKLSDIMPVNQIEKRVFKDEDFIENRYKNLISIIHSMEGHTLAHINSKIINNNNTAGFLDEEFFYLGIPSRVNSTESCFNHFEHALMFNQLNIKSLDDYIGNLHPDEHLERMQCIYTLSKVRSVGKARVRKLVVTNPYSRGLKELMYAFASVNDTDKEIHYESALQHLTHIKYHYLEALYYYCRFLKSKNDSDYKLKVSEGRRLSKQYFYQYLNYLFETIDETVKVYEFSYSFYPLSSLNEYVIIHNRTWEKILQERSID